MVRVPLGGHLGSRPPCRESCFGAVFSEKARAELGVLPLRALSCHRGTRCILCGSASASFLFLLFLFVAVALCGDKSKERELCSELAARSAGTFLV